MTNNVGHYFMCLFVSCIFSVAKKCLCKFFTHFLLCCLSSYYWVVRVLFTFCTQSFIIYTFCEYISKLWLFLISFIVFFKEENILIWWSQIYQNLSFMFFVPVSCLKNCQRFSFMLSTRIFIILELYCDLESISTNFNMVWIKGNVSSFFNLFLILGIQMFQ